MKTPQESSSSQSKSNSQVKQPKKPKKKTFLGNEDTLSLALAIGGAQEDIVSEKNKNRPPREAEPPKEGKVSGSRKYSEWRIKIKETKAALAAKKAQHKKEKAQKKKGPAGPSPPALDNVEKKPAKKSVSFA
ncbi:hypothetical protein DFP72DRAFT_1075134 [Ephemerocybe angulata]|uniref:Uncharacterized protein n=1 Tax=Ephemerocybe angulata TaxID=980116 RepID=A0A8H6HJR0_9AGAR|nr:hypothetical protein DFP72DRAFT_1075134 [Tulosesus angulatus]